MRNLPHGFDIYLVNVKTMRKVAQIFVAFSEKLNFNIDFVAKITLSAFLHANGFWTQIPHIGHNDHSCSVSRETTDVTVTRGMLWSDKV